MYKGSFYKMGDEWDDGCDFHCKCVDENSGRYQCTAKWVNINQWSYMQIDITDSLSFYIHYMPLHRVSGLLWCMPWHRCQDRYVVCSDIGCLGLYVVYPGIGIRTYVVYCHDLYVVCPDIGCHRLYVLCRDVHCQVIYI